MNNIFYRFVTGVYLLSHKSLYLFAYFSVGRSIPFLVGGEYIYIHIYMNIFRNIFIPFSAIFERLTALRCVRKQRTTLIVYFGLSLRFTSHFGFFYTILSCLYYCPLLKCLLIVNYFYIIARTTKIIAKVLIFVFVELAFILFVI